MEVETILRCPHIEVSHSYMYLTIDIGTHTQIPHENLGKQA